jgi:hypothetical protein
MGDISRTALFGKLNSVAYKAIEGATVFCKLRGNPYVEVVHWIHQILQLQGSDLHSIARAFNLDPGKIAREPGCGLLSNMAICRYVRGTWSSRCSRPRHSATCCCR